MNMKNNKHFKTSDLPLATTLSLTFPIEQIDNSNPRRVEFLFNATTSLLSLVEDYWKGKVTVEPKTFFNQLRVLKSRIYDQ